MKIKTIQGLRAIAALLVVTVHIGGPDGIEARYLLNPHPFLTGISAIGSLGVDLFFIVSGFIMVVTSIRSDGTRISSGEFLRHRIIRLYPPLWIINTLVLAVFLVKPSLINSHASARPNILASYLLLPQAGLPLLLVSWTLVFEMYFYLVFAIGLIGGQVRTLKMTLAAWGVFIAGMALAFSASPNTYLAFIGNPILLEFLLGAVIGALARRRLSQRAGFVLVGIGVVALSVVGALVESGAMYLLGGWLRVGVSVPLAAFVLGVVTFEQHGKLSTPSALEHVGDASYAIYLWHIPTLTVVGFALRALHPHTWPVQFAGLVVAYAMVIVTGLAVYRWIERPMTSALRGRSNTLVRQLRHANERPFL